MGALPLFFEERPGRRGPVNLRDLTIPHDDALDDDLVVDGDQIDYHWTFTGTNTGPGGTGNAVRVVGYEEWTIGDDGLIAASSGHYDQAEYARQLEEGV